MAANPHQPVLQFQAALLELDVHHSRPERGAALGVGAVVGFLALAALAAQDRWLDDLTDGRLLEGGFRQIARLSRPAITHLENASRWIVEEVRPDDLPNPSMVCPKTAKRYW